MHNDLPESMSLLASAGGKARAKKLSGSRRVDIAQKAAAARWNSELPKATHVGTIEIGTAVIPCAVLEDGRRVLTQQGFLQAIGRARSAKGGQGATVDELPAFIAAKNLNAFIDSELRESTKPVIFRTISGIKAFGYEANLLTKVCRVYLAARDADALTESQQRIARVCDILLRGLADTGIVALVDEATGYEDDRPQRALAKILEKFVAKELQRWVSTFPPDFYREMFRLRKIEYSGRLATPKYIGHLTNNLVYKRLAPGVLAELRQRNPVTETGRRKHTHHQHLTPDKGHPRLLHHLGKVTGLMTISSTWEEFEKLIDKHIQIYKHYPLLDGPNSDE